MSNSNFVLIVDDNPDNLAVLSQTLKGAGYAIRIAIDGESALQQMAKGLPTLILLDVMMPGIDGFETCQRLKENPETSAIPVIFMTALTDGENKVKGLELGAVDYIAKPFNEAEVLARVRIQIKMQELLQTLQDQNQQLKQEVKLRQQAENSLQQLNDELEQRVKQRTLQLEQAQVKQIQQEKLSALGELMSGVAHEINNPMGCIANNIRFVQEYGAQLLEHIQIYQQTVPQPKETVLDHAEEIDLDHIAHDFPNLMTSMQMSSGRIRAISHALRTFARQDLQHKSEFDLHDGLDSTLMILKHRLKGNDRRGKIEVTKAYGNVPLVLCYPGQINQVLMNILANAIDAFEESDAFEGQGAATAMLTIRTEHRDNQVLIQIADNAGGMPETVRSQIFNHAYTTKAVGKGTGLGLSITRQIVVENHGGDITCHSVLGQGSEFTITLPV